MSTYVIQGLEEFEERVNALILEVQRKVLTAAGRAGAELIRAEMERTAPRLTGFMAEHEIVSLIAGESSAFYVLFRIGPARAAFYSLFEELGTAHQTADPFIEPSFEAKKDAAEKAVTDAFLEAIS